MYVAVVVLTMVVLPIISVLIQHAQSPVESLAVLTGRWFVFWGVGVRLGLAGLRQIVQPSFTARTIFQMTNDEALPLVRELGIANAGTALVALLSIVAPSFVLPASISAALFFGAAGVTHLAGRDRSRHETIAMVSDIFIAVVLVVCVASTLLSRGRHCPPTSEYLTWSDDSVA
jgi:hypothetical protein